MAEEEGERTPSGCNCGAKGSGPKESKLRFSRAALNAASGGCYDPDQLREVLARASKAEVETWAEWREEFAEYPQGAAIGLARLFPHTAPRAYRRWLQMRSPGANDAAEPLTQEDARSTLFPIADPTAWEYRKLIEKHRWSAHEVRMEKDAGDMAAVDATYRWLLECVLGFFGMSDEGVLEGLDGPYLNGIKQKEAQHYMRAVSEQESVHSEAYGLQIQEVVAPGRQAAVFRAVETMKAVGRMADWMRFWARGDHALADRFVASAHGEGVMFSGHFATIQNTKNMNILAGVTTFNELISRDEGLHTAWWCFLIRERLAAPPDPAVAAAIAREVVALCDAFFAEAIPAPTGGLSAELLRQHIRSVSAQVSAASGYAPLYDDKSPFAFMDNLALNAIGKSNFFEGDVTQYQMPDDPEAYRFAIDESPVGDV